MTERTQLSTEEIAAAYQILLLEYPLLKESSGLMKQLLLGFLVEKLGLPFIKVQQIDDDYSSARVSEPDLNDPQVRTTARKVDQFVDARNSAQ